jgi:hypothetical protein
MRINGISAGWIYNSQPAEVGWTANPNGCAQYSVAIFKTPLAGLNMKIKIK